MKFTEKGRIAINKTKDLVISEREDGYIVIAQQITVDENEEPLGVFLKNTVALDRASKRALIDILNKV